MVLRDLEIAKFTNSHIHVPHVSAGKSVKHINSVKKEYDKVTAEVTPHHLFFTDEDLQNYNKNLGSRGVPFPKEFLDEFNNAVENTKIDED